ncbi:MAG TPA: hypothetical protein VGO62_08680 [Myxococcota bacterium]|jgi:hypothetical protein
MRFASLWCAFVALELAGCPKPAAPAVVDAGSSDPEHVKGSDSIKANYDASTKPDPRATALCQALFDLPAQKRDACCNAPAAASSPITSTCVGLLSAALLDKDLAYDDAAAKACIAGRTQQFTGCGFVGPVAPQFPTVCSNVLHGSLDSGARCKTSLACKPGLRCLGAGPLDPGRCGAPLPDGSSCAFAVDALSVVVDQPSIDRAHPMCEHACGHFKCRAVEKPGDACANDFDCGSANHCGAGKCVAGLIALGQACDKTGCVDGAICIDSKCQPKRKEGETCTDAFQCESGGCPRSKSDPTRGTCGMNCNVFDNVVKKKP